MSAARPLLPVNPVRNTYPATLLAKPAVASANPARLALVPEPTSPSEADPELVLYRLVTLRLLRRYQRMSMGVGRVPTLLGGEVFRSKFRSPYAGGFENAVIFVHDVEKILARLDPASRQIIAHVVLEEYTQAEASRMVSRSRRQVQRRYTDALDCLSNMFLAGGLIRRLPQM